MSNAGKKQYTYILVMSNGEIAETSLYSGNDTEKKAYLKHFLEVSRDQDLYFVDNLSGIMYNKNHVVSCREKVV
jgi:hypothetical protein